MLKIRESGVSSNAAYILIKSGKAKNLRLFKYIHVVSKCGVKLGSK